MEWKKTADAAATWAGGVHPKTLYAAVRRGELQCVRFGAGRNMLFCEAWITEWLLSVADRRTALINKVVTHTRRSSL